MARRGQSHTGLTSVGGGPGDGDKIVDGKLSFLQARSRIKAVVMRVKYSGGVQETWMEGVNSVGERRIILLGFSSNLFSEHYTHKL
jgi:hypothetical protein